jgi:alpha-N-acetylglucosaminidase
MLCLDLVCETNPQWSRTQAFYGKPWVWCNIQNFGNTLFLGGNLSGINKGIMAVKQSPDRGRISGLGFVNEGLGYNPVIQDLMFEMAWRDGAVDLDAWVRRYAGYRYGRSNPHAQQAWDILQNTVYRAPNRYRSAYTLLPSMKPARRAAYDNRKLAAVWENLLKAADSLGALDTYRFDLVNVARQGLSNHAAVLQRRVVKAYNAKNVTDFRSASNAYLQLMLDLDELLATREEFLLGRTLEDAKRWGTTPEEKSILEWNARRVLTLWGATPRIDDYARKEWSGMISGYYYVRWKKYLDEIGKALETGKPFDNGAFRRELRTWMVAWSDAKDTYLSEPKGDSLAIAKALWEKYGDTLRPSPPVGADVSSLTTQGSRP